MLRPIDCCFRFDEPFPLAPLDFLEAIVRSRGDRDGVVNPAVLALYDVDSRMVVSMSSARFCSLMFRFAVSRQVIHARLFSLALLIFSTSGYYSALALTKIPVTNQKVPGPR